jgi:puromycin-sensitive aminopeptidase
MSEAISRRQAFKSMAKQARFMLVLPVAQTLLSAFAPASVATTTTRPKGEEMNLDDTPGSVDPYRLPRHIIPNRYEIRLEPDLVNASFAGKETIALTVTRATSAIILNAVDLAIASATLEGPSSMRLEATVALEDSMQRCHLTFPQSISPGEWRLHLTFQGKLNDQLRGFYRSTYKDMAGVTHTMAATQFEATDARRAFPC